MQVHSENKLTETHSIHALDRGEVADFSSGHLLGNVAGFSYRVPLRWTAIALGLVDCWVTRHKMVADGVAYLDMGDAYWRGDWHTAINGLWSPLYSWLLGLAIKVLRPSAYWEFPVVHLVNFIVYLGALASFEFLLRTLVDYHNGSTAESETCFAPLPEWVWYAVGYPIFLWTSFELIKLGTATPDMCVAAFLYLAAGLVIKVRQREKGWATFVSLGVVLAIGYLAKAIMFPIGFVFLAVAFYSAGPLSKGLPRTLAATAICLAVSAPFLIALSIAVGHPTFGESGRLNYIWFVDHSGFGTLKHPMEKIHDAPLVLSFANPVAGTYPPWYDPTYWNEGLKAHFDLHNQIRALKLTSSNYYNLLFMSDAGLVAVVIVLFAMSPLGPLQALKSICENWRLLIPAIAGLGAFLVLKVEGRYVGPFALLMWLGILSGLRLARSEESHRLLGASVLAVLITVGLPVVSSVVFDWSEARHAGAVDWQTAQALHHAGVQPGDKVAFIRRSPWGDFFWARLAKVQIIAEVPPSDADAFWTARPSTQADVFAAIAKTGAKAIIATEKPPYASAAWQQLGTTERYAHLLHEANSPALATTSLHP